MEILDQDVLIFRKADTGFSLLLGHKCSMEVLVVNREVLPHFLMTFAMDSTALMLAPSSPLLCSTSLALLIVLQLTVSAILTMKSSIVPWEPEVDVGYSSSRSVWVPRV